MPTTTTNAKRLRWWQGKKSFNAQSWGPHLVHLTFSVILAKQRSEDKLVRTRCKWPLLP